MYYLAVKHLIVDLICQNYELVFFSNLSDLLEQTPAVNHACGIIRVDQYNASCAWRHQATNLFRVRLKAVFRLAIVVNRPAVVE